MAREKDGYRDALERIRHEAAGEMVTVAEPRTSSTAPIPRRPARSAAICTAGPARAVTSASRPPRWRGKFADDNG